MKLILLRHGETAANEQKRYCGTTDIPLSAAGKAALQQRKEAKNYPEVIGFSVITSDLLRCEQTLAILYGAVPHTTERALREMDFGDFEMRSYEQLKTDARYIEWISGENENKPAPGGESGAQMTARVLEVLARVMQTNKNTLIVTHGGVIAAMMAHLFQNESKSRYEWQPKPGGGYIIDLEEKNYKPF